MYVSAYLLKLQIDDVILDGHGQAYHGIPLRKMGGQFYWALGTLKFSSTPGGLSQMRGLKFFTLFFWGGGGQLAFLCCGDEGSPSLSEILLIPTPPGKKSLSVDSQSLI